MDNIGTADVVVVWGMTTQQLLDNNNEVAEGG